MAKMKWKTQEEIEEEKRRAEEEANKPTAEEKIEQLQHQLTTTDMTLDTFLLEILPGIMGP